jgi:hypothetical protein
MLFAQSFLRDAVDFFPRVFVYLAAFEPRINFLDWSAERDRDVPVARFKNFVFQAL